MRGFTREVFDRMDLRSNGMEFASEFVIKAAQLGAKTSEIPITLWKDKRGRPPHLRSFRDGWRHLRFMLLYAPNWLFLLPGGLLMAAGLFLTFWLLPGPRKVAPSVVLDVHTMIFGVIFTLMGAQILAIGAFAKVFSYAERFDRNTVSLKRILKRVTFESGLLLGGALFSAGLWRMRVHHLGMGSQRIRSAAAGERSAVLVDVAVSGSADYFFFVLSQHAGHQPRHVHRRLRSLSASDARSQHCQIDALHQRSITSLRK